MRGRILMAGLLATGLTACSKRDSLYIDISRDGAPPEEAATPLSAGRESVTPANPHERDAAALRAN